MKSTAQKAMSLWGGNPAECKRLEAARSQDRENRNKAMAATIAAAAIAKLEANRFDLSTLTPDERATLAKP